jgi:hypothetical protein
MQFKNEEVMNDYQEYNAQGRIWGFIKPERITKIKFPRIRKEIIEEYLAIDDITSTVSDVLDSMGICGALPASELSPVIPGKRLRGPQLHCAIYRKGKMFTAAMQIMISLK